MYVTVVLVGVYLRIELLVVGPEVGTTAPLEATLLTVLTVVWACSLARMGRRVSAELTGDSRFDSRVEDISIRSTVVRTRDDMLLTVPNSVLNTATLILPAVRL